MHDHNEYGGRPSLGTMRASTVAILCYFMLIPTYVLVQTLIVARLVPPIFGGLSTPLAVLCFPPLLATFTLNLFQGGVRLVKWDWLFFVFTALFGVVGAVGLIELPATVAPVTHITTSFQFFVYYLCFRQIDWQDGFTKLLALLAYCVILLTIAFSFNHQAYNPYNTQLDIIFYRDHMGAALCVIIASFALLATVRSSRGRLIIYALSVAVLIVNGARSEALVAPAAFAIHELVASRAKIFAVVTLVISVILVALSFPLIETFGDADRLTRLLEDYQSDRSYQERVWSVENGLNTISAHPIFGSYASYPEGLYAHNALSAWVDLGVVGFALYVVLLLVPMRAVGISRLSGRWSSHAAATVASAMFLICLAIFAKSFIYKLLPFTVAMYAVLDGRLRPVRRNIGGAAWPKFGSST